jgi:lactoylglutathione lyase
VAVRKFGALVLFSSQLVKMVSFYKALGLPLEEEVHEKESPLHYACEVGTVHFAIYESSNGRSSGLREGGSSILGFQIDHLDEVLIQMKTQNFSIASGPEDRPWGRRAIIIDPDGRAVEIWETL